MERSTAKLTFFGSPKKTSRSSSKNPTPEDLSRFVPWMFAELQSAQTVTVRTSIQDTYRPRHRRKSISKAARMLKNIASGLNLTPKVESYNPTTDSTSAIANSTSITTGAAGGDAATLVSTENTIYLTTCYNRAGKIVEIVIHDCSFPISRKLIETISLCMPFHTLLNKFTCKGNGLDYSVIDEMAKMLPFSHLTDICLDNTFVPQGNYYILLDPASLLKSLSLNRCSINDVVCKKLAERLEFGCPASRNLQILCLSSNFITDVGAQALGQVLRTNRHLLHLNLCGNSITSEGAAYLLQHLSEFRLTKDEVGEKIRRRREYYKKKTVIDSIYEPPAVVPLKSSPGKEERKKSIKKTAIESITSKVNEIMICDYVFGPPNTVYKNGCWFATGNLVLCSLNLGHNNLDYTSLSKIIGVLSYQADRERASGRTGLLRIIIEGNYLPVNCEEYSKIKMYLNMLSHDAMSFIKKQESPVSGRARRNTVQLIEARENYSSRSAPPTVLSPVLAQ